MSSAIDQNKMLAVCLMPVLGLLLGTFIPQANPYLFAMIVGGCAFILREQILKPGIWQLVALGAYIGGLSLIFPVERPNTMTVLSEPLFHVGAMLLVLLFVTRADAKLLLFFFCALLLLCVAGLIGEMRGREMVYLLPFKMPDYEWFDELSVNWDGSRRYRGFFAEASILGSVVASTGMLTMIACVLLFRKHFSKFLVAGGFGFAAIAFLFVLGTTQTKSGMFIFSAGLAGLLAAVFIFSRPAIKLRLALFTVTGLGAAGYFVSTSKSPQIEYARNELAALPAALSGDISILRQHGGLITRIECWRCAVETLRYQPLGTGRYGLGEVLHRSQEITFTPEMEYWFQRGVFGLKNALANIIAQGGFVGLLLLAGSLWSLFIRPVFQRDQTAQERLCAAIIHFPALSISVAMLASGELYPHMAFLVLFKGLAAVAVEPQIIEETLPAEEKTEPAALADSGLAEI